MANRGQHMKHGIEYGNVIYRNATSSAIGSVSLAGVITHGRGTSGAHMRVFGHYALAYIFSGCGSYRDANGLEQRIVAGDMILVFPQLAHRYQPNAGEHWSEIYLVFDGPVFELWESIGLLDPRRPIHHLEPIDFWVRHLRSILSDDQKPRSTNQTASLLEVCRLQQALAQALTGNSRAGSHRDEQWEVKACALLEADLERQFDLRQMANELGESHDSFRKRFTRSMGMPPGQWRSRRIIDRACELIQQTDLPNKQIARRLGFCDQFHFSRRFKQITGSSPTQFRRRLAQVV